VSRSADRKEDNCASRSSFTDADRSGCAAVAGKSIHPDGRQYQIDPKRSGGDCGGAVALEFVWAAAQSLAISRGYVKKLGVEERQPQASDRNRLLEIIRIFWKVQGKHNLIQERSHGGTIVKSIRVIGTTAVFLLLGFAIPAHARQDQKEKETPPKQQEKTAAPKQEQQAKPQEQQQAKPAKQQQQAKPVKQQEAKAPAKEQQAKPEAQKQSKAQPQRAAQQKPAQQQAKAQPQQQHQQQAKSSQRPQRTQQAIEQQRAQPQLRLTVVSSSRIPQARFQSNFGRQHNFRISSPRIIGGFSRFQYGGYWFGFVQPWPDGWYYTDDVYIDFIDGGYYLYNPYYPGARVSISVVL
jgi:hypothetical protein